MLTIAGYTIDRIASITAQPGGIALCLESGQKCVIRDDHPSKQVLVSWAELNQAVRVSLALLIVDGEVRNVAKDDYLAVSHVRLREDDTLDLWLIGRNGHYLHRPRQHPDDEAHRALLLRGAETKFPLYLLMHGPSIVAVADLSAEQHQALVALGAITNNLKPGVADSWIFGQSESG
jgi:hypothetical protein